MVNPLQLRESLNHLRDILFRTLRDNENERNKERKNNHANIHTKLVFNIFSKYPAIVFSFIDKEKETMERGKSRKRPCRICRKWYYPDPRVGERQKTCGDKWHAKKCAEWNKKKPAYYREIYLSKKLDVLKVNTRSGDHPPPLSNSSRALSALSSTKSSQVPRDLIQEVIRRQLTEIKREFKQLPREAISRGDGILRGS